MSILIPTKAGRGSVLRRVIGAGAASLAVPLMPRLNWLEAPSLISSARAAGNPGAEKGRGDLVHIPGKDVKISMFAEW